MTATDWPARTDRDAWDTITETMRTRTEPHHGAASYRCAVDPRPVTGATGPLFRLSPKGARSVGVCRTHARTEIA